MKRWARGAAVLAALALLLLGVGYHNATRPPEVVRVTHQLPGLPPGTRLRVLLIGDIHYGHPDMRTARLLAITRQANAEKPDLVLLAGDYMGGKLVDWPRSWLEEALPPLAALKAPMGVWAVLGNHDEAHWTPLVLSRQASPRLLLNSHVDLGPVVLAGLDSLAHGPDFGKAMDGAPAKPLVLLLHEPETLQRLQPPGRKDVVALAAHTHGGQIVIPLLGRPGALLLGREPCWRGACTINGWPAYVTSGVGTTLVPLRIGVPPEMVLLTLVPG